MVHMWELLTGLRWNLQSRLPDQHSLPDISIFNACTTKACKLNWNFFVPYNCQQVFLITKSISIKYTTKIKFSVMGLSDNIDSFR